jgi:hypothetical protein
VKLASPDVLRGTEPARRDRLEAGISRFDGQV